MAQRRVTQGAVAANSIALVLTPTLAIPNVPAGTVGFRPYRLLRLYVSYFGGSADAVQVKAVIPSPDLSGNLTFRKKAGAGTTAGWDVEWDFTSTGLTLVPGASTTITVSTTTVADAGSAAPTILSATAVWEENA